LAPAVARRLHAGWWYGGGTGASAWRSARSRGRPGRSRRQHHQQHGAACRLWPMAARDVVRRGAVGPDVSAETVHRALPLFGASAHGATDGLAGAVACASDSADPRSWLIEPSLGFGGLGLHLGSVAETGGRWRRLSPARHWEAPRARSRSMRNVALPD